ncbi:ALQxL family class IV lanthipeptide [Microbispora sp. KK1-11]|nr:ALQxL family class IV lanthipeptide [Microbispora sp. KK1-11]
MELDLNALQMLPEAQPGVGLQLCVDSCIINTCRNIFSCYPVTFNG